MATATASAPSTGPTASSTSTASGATPQDGKTLGVINPATEEVIAEMAFGSRADANAPSRPPSKAMAGWMKLTACDRAKVLKKTADLMRERADAIARTLTMEQGKPLAEAKARGAALGRHLRVVRRGRQARLRPGHPQLACRASGT